MDAFSLLAFVLALLALLLIVPLALLLSIRTQEVFRPYFVLLSPGKEPVREVPINGDTTIFTESFPGVISLVQGLGGVGSRLTITNASSEGVLLRSDLFINTPKEYITEEGDILLPAERTTNFVLQSPNRLLFLGSYSL